MLRDLRTIWPYARHAVVPPRAPAAVPWETSLEDADRRRVRLTGALRSAAGTSECVLLVHGLGGCSESYYVRRGAGVAGRLGMDSLGLCLRGADRLGEDFYNIALHGDLAAAVASPALARYERIYVLGYSMGGYVAMHFALHVADPRVRAVVALCTPIDLKVAQVHIDSRRAWLYRHHCLGGLKAIYEAVARAHPERIPTENERVQAVRTMRDWDALAIAPRYGYASPEDYYEHLTLRRSLGDFRVPVRMVASPEDPIVPAHTIQAFLEAARRPSAHGLEVTWVRGGGHVVFPADLDLGQGPVRGVEAQLLQWARGRA